MRNQDIRCLIKSAGVKMWQVAELYGISDGNFSRKLRYELSPNDKTKIIEIINQLKEDSKNKN